MRSAIVIGAGPAGLSAALGFLRRGIGTRVLDQKRGWSGRVCGSFVDAEGVRSLRWLGVAEPALASPSARVATVDVWAGCSRGTLPIGPHGEEAWAIPRRHLEEKLAEAVEARGGAITWGCRARGARRESGRWIVSARRTIDVASEERSVDGAPRDENLDADFLVFADGRFSRSPARAARGDWFGWNARFSDVDQAPGALSLFFYPGGYVGLLAFADGTANVCGLVRKASDGALDWDAVFDRARGALPALAARFARARRLDAWRGVGPLPFSFERAADPGAMLAGDAAGVGDPFMGEGNGRALAAGPLLASALDAGGSVEAVAERYAATWRRTYGGRLRSGAALRWLLSHPAAGGPAIAVATRFPAALSRLTPLFHAGFRPATPPNAPVDIL